LRAPAALVVSAEKFLIFVKDMARRRERSRRRIGGATPSAAIRPDQAEVAHMVGGADGGALLEFLVDVALPEIGRLEDVHIAVENFETVIGHGSPRDLFKPFKSFNSFKPTVSCNRPKYVLNDFDILNAQSF
jgi:hypothetical protein